MLTSSEKKQLDEQGYLVLPECLTPARVAAYIDLVEACFAKEGESAGSEFKQEPNTRRLANCVNKGELFEQAIQNPKVLAGMEAVLGDDFKLSSLNVRSANPNSASGQPLHADSGAIADEIGYWVCNSVWMLDDFTPENGALRIVPGSHRLGRIPTPGAKDPNEMPVTGKAGTVVIMNAHMWHGGTDNRTDKPRRAMHVYYTRGDKPQQQYQKALLKPAVQKRQNALGRHLLALDDLRNDVLSATGSGVSGFLR